MKVQERFTADNFVNLLNFNIGKTHKENLLDGLASNDPEPVRYASSGPTKSSTPIPTVANGDDVTANPAIVSANGESGAGKTVNTESGTGKTVNGGSGGQDASILNTMKLSTGPPYNPFKWKLAPRDPKLQLSPENYIKNQTIVADVKKFMDAGDHTMFRYTNFRNVINPINKKKF